jgi:hypothetical protein
VSAIRRNRFSSRQPKARRRLRVHVWAGCGTAITHRLRNIGMARAWRLRGDEGMHAHRPQRARRPALGGGKLDGYGMYLLAWEGVTATCEGGTNSRSICRRRGQEMPSTSHAAETERQQRHHRPGFGGCCSCTPFAASILPRTDRQSGLRTWGRVKASRRTAGFAGIASLAEASAGRDMDAAGGRRGDVWTGPRATIDGVAPRPAGSTPSRADRLWWSCWCRPPHAAAGETR